MITAADLESLGFSCCHSGSHHRLYARNYLIEGSWAHASATYALWRGEWNWQVEIYGHVPEPNAPQAAVRHCRLYNPTPEELETALALMRVPGVRVSRDKRGAKVTQAD